MNHAEKPTPGTPAWQIKTLADSARQLASTGDLAGAEKIYEKILEAAPYHIRSLNALATRAIERGDNARAQSLLERALEVASDRPILHENLGHIYNARNEKERALACFGKAAALKPEYVYPWIYQAEILEALNRHDEAAFMFAKVAKMAPPPSVIATDPAIRDDKRPLILKAIASLNKIMCRYLLDSLQDTVAEYGESALQRILECIKIKSGVIPATYQHILQHPDWLYIPDLKPQAFFDPTEFDWIEDFQSHMPQIKNELLALLDSKARLEPYVQIEGTGDKQQWTTLNYSAAWSSYHLLKAAGPVTENSAHCPETMTALRDIPLAQIEQHAPEVFFSILQPGTHIPPHHGLGNYKLAVHLPLLIPDACKIRVGHETRGWSEGQCMIFDDSFQHEAWNESTQIRAVLIMEIWNPRLTEAERVGVKKVIEGINSFNMKYEL